jgi:hypothetical protein
MTQYIGVNESWTTLPSQWDYSNTWYNWNGIFQPGSTIEYISSVVDLGSVKFITPSTKVVTVNTSPNTIITTSYLSSTDNDTYTETTTPVFKTRWFSTKVTVQLQSGMEGIETVSTSYTINSINENDDVLLTNETPGELLVYNGTHWENNNISVNDLSNVNISTPSTNQVLKYDGTNWINGTDDSGTGGTGGASEINELTDVNISTPSTNQVLKYDGTNWVNGTDDSGGGGGGSGMTLWEEDWGTYSTTEPLSYTLKTITIPPNTLTANNIFEFEYQFLIHGGFVSGIPSNLTASGTGYFSAYLSNNLFPELKNQFSAYTVTFSNAWQGVGYSTDIRILNNNNDYTTIYDKQTTELDSQYDTSGMIYQQVDWTQTAYIHFTAHTTMNQTISLNGYRLLIN